MLAMTATTPMPTTMSRTRNDDDNDIDTDVDDEGGDVIHGDDDDGETMPMTTEFNDTR